MHYIYIISYVTAILTFIPLMMRLEPYTGDSMGSFPAELSVKDPIYVFSIILGMGISMPFMVEILFQLFARLIKGINMMDSDIFLRW